MIPFYSTKKWLKPAPLLGFGAISFGVPL